MLRGDEVGALLAQHLLELRREGVYATSIVSSSLLGKMAVAEKQLYAETLTGFKWIGRVENLAFGYEEALGYCVDPAHVKDKDGVSRADAGLRHRRPRQGGRPHAASTCSTTSPAPTACTPPTSSRCGWTTSTRSRPCDGPAARPAADLARRTRGRAGRRPLARVRATSPRRSGCASGSPTTAGSSYALGDGAEAQVLPRGRRTREDDQEDGVDAARISAVGRLDAIRGDLQAAAGL